MIISANGIVINEYGDVLLVERDDTRTFAPPGGACEIDELPNDAAVREVQEETGLIVYPVRLVGLYYLPTHPEAFLFLCFRCIPRGGELATSEETPRSGFFETNALPSPILTFHKEQIERAFNHIGGAPDWSEHQVSPMLRMGNLLLNRLVYPWLRFRRSRLGLPAYVPPPQWQVRATMIFSNNAGDILLLRIESHKSWLLPSTDVSTSKPPWILANQYTRETLGKDAVLSDISGIYLRQGKPQMEFVFTGSLKEGDELPEFPGALVAPESLPENLSPDHQLMVADALAPGEQTIYKILK